MIAGSGAKRVSLGVSTPPYGALPNGAARLRRGSITSRRGRADAESAFGTAAAVGTVAVAPAVRHRGHL